MDAPWFRRKPGGGAGRNERPRRNVRLEFTTLEDRQVPAISSVTVVVTPKALTPNKGEPVTVHVSGIVTQVITHDLPAGTTTSPDWTDFVADENENDASPIPYEVLGIITDQYRRDEPRVTSDIEPEVVGGKTFFRKAVGTAPPSIVTVREYDYAFNVTLLASARSIGRQYDIGVFANDFASGAGGTGFAYVPGSSVKVKAK